MKDTEINLFAECVNQIGYGIKNNADLKTYSVHAHLNPGLENCINKLIRHYFCTCVIPFVMLKCTVEGGCWGGWKKSRCVMWARERWILLRVGRWVGASIVLLCICIWLYVLMWVCACANIHF